MTKQITKKEVKEPEKLWWKEMWLKLKYEIMVTTTTTTFAAVAHLLKNSEFDASQSSSTTKATRSQNVNWSKSWYFGCFRQSGGHNMAKLSGKFYS